MTATVDRPVHPDYSRVDVLQDRVTELLDSLPERPIDIAIMFRQLGVSGVPLSGDECALAEWLQLVTGRSLFVSPDSVEVTGLDPNGYELDGWVSVPCPSRVTRFISLFDEGYFPLITRPDVSL